VTGTGPTGPDLTHAQADATAVLPADGVQPSPDAGLPDGPDEPDAPPPASGGSSRGKRARRLAIEWIVLIGAALLIAFLIKSFLFQAFYIPSGSMEPTLNIGDRVLVNKLSYDLHDVNRGDIVVFEAPESAQSGDIEDLVKRVIGLPGDTVTYDASGHVVINGKRLNEPYLPAGSTTEPLSQPVPPGCGTPDGDQPGCVVPKGTVLVLGDNRGSSKDGRAFGPIQQDSIVGRVFLRIWPIDSIGTL
jgi:signal peptidase I